MELPGAWYPPAPSPTLHSSEQAEPQQESPLIFVLIVHPEFLHCFNSEQTLQQAEGVGREPESLMYLLRGFLPTTAETMEVFVGQERNRPIGKSQERHWSNLAKWWVCCCDLLLWFSLTVIQRNCQMGRGCVVKRFINLCGPKKT